MTLLRSLSLVFVGALWAAVASGGELLHADARSRSRCRRVPTS